MRKYKGSLRDQYVDFKFWWKNWGQILGFVGGNPITVAKALFNYPWIYDLLKANDMVKRQTDGINGAPLRMINMSLYYVIELVIDQLKGALTQPQDTVIAQVMLPSQIYQAMGLKFFTPELQLDTAVAMCDARAFHRYLDLIESRGVPGDTCSFPRITAGASIAHHFPTASCIVTSNLPCDGGQASYYAMQQNFDLPMFTVDVPYNFHEEEGLEAIVEDIYGLIAFLEETTGHKLDWAELKRICERYNQVNEIELENREMIRSGFPPITNLVPWMNHVLWFNVCGGTEKALEVLSQTNRLMKEAYRNREVGVRNLRYRAVLWNPPTMMYSNWWPWLERCWGIGILSDMENYGFEEFIDTSSNDSMLRSLAHNMGCAPMSRHTRGSHDNYLNDFISMAEVYNADIMIVANHMGCRNSMAMNGAMREVARKYNIPLCIIDYELYDIRICSRQGIRDQISNFMRSVMNAEPLDESLLVIDDESSW